MIPPEIVLTIVGGPCAQRKAAFRKERILIGRGGGGAGDLAVFSLDEDISVSRDQAVIVFEDGQYRIENHSKHETTTVNGRFHETTAIKNGDIIEVGRTPSRIQVRLVDSKPPKTAGVPDDHVNRRQWIRIAAGGLVLLLAVVIVGKVLHPFPPSTPLVDVRRLAMEARNAGDLNKAMLLLLPTITNSEENTDLYLKCKVLSRKFDTARRCEDVLQLDRALDEWRSVAVEVLEKDDPLQVWVQTGQVDRLEKKLKEVGL